MLEEGQWGVWGRLRRLPVRKVKIEQGVGLSCAQTVISLNRCASNSVLVKVADEPTLSVEHLEVFND